MLQASLVVVARSPSIAFHKNGIKIKMKLNQNLTEDYVSGGVSRNVKNAIFHLHIDIKFVIYDKMVKTTTVVFSIR